jgi:hypothetical protein
MDNNTRHFGDTTRQMINIAFELDQISTGKQVEADICLNGNRIIPSYNFPPEIKAKLHDAKYAIHKTKLMIDLIDYLITTGNTEDFTKSWDELCLSEGSSC